ncbi:cyclic lactone autoinducer peptide [Listeria booriae]|uniref:cyclic lactone autoinducer peptide n=1 Tax=Listeria booriae TaxID=1552123 RepID=UPI001625EF91|nr:cyclic lactone autoinducer peptide [Listeria booriae]MBC1359122.1 cyclic lactone autoinducer peptide [Listeria booriae]MBC1813311.1 cyclic lactone autoinducer peptide [Listeria booriae]MBC2170320.1 cyclic lactone autoinducer peptide [Listeria booriae]MBC2369794.1 cyclic lactone autoinducer peptide [Listeria booriae]MDT0110518.1 cyclic lactone autoinducer peptide [Listeria booriae]
MSLVEKYTKRISDKIICETEVYAANLARKSTKKACSVFIYEPEIPKALLKEIK